jgi:hypothetical protein
MNEAIADDSLTSQVRALLTRVLQGVKFPGRDELLAQVADVRVVGGPITMLDLEVARSAPRSSISDGPAPAAALVRDQYGVESGELLVWIKDGYVNGLEYAWLSDDEPEHLPSASTVHVGMQ